MRNKIMKQLQMFKIALAVLMILNAYLLLTAFENKTNKAKFEEIDVERINVIGTNEKPVMVISNKRLIPGPIINGKSYPREFADGRENLSGIIFFNDQGDEVGGLLYNGIAKDSGYSAVEHFSFDQWKQNQVIAMQYLDNGKSRRAGIRVYDRPVNVPLDEIFDRYKARNVMIKNSLAYDSITKEIKASNLRGDNGIERMFVGSQDEVAQIQLKDKQGKVRIKLYVDKTGEAKILFYDKEGKVILSIPD
jgi:hypothetical protein